MTKIRLAILASGNGSNAEAIMSWAKSNALAEVVCTGSDKKDAYVLTRAKNFNVPSFVVKKKKGEERSSFDGRLLLKLATFSPDWIILAGYMKLLTPIFLEKYRNRVINIHPSLLPDFPGLDGHGDAFRAGVLETGCTVHYVDEGLDTGPIIAQKKFSIIKGETFLDFKKRGLAIENEFYPAVIEKLLKETL